LPKQNTSILEENSEYAKLYCHISKVPNQKKYVTEADIYLELILQELMKYYNYKPEEIFIVTYDYPFNDEKERGKITTFAKQNNKLVVLLENESTNTGTNISCSLEFLDRAGILNKSDKSMTKEFASKTILMQQPALQKRSKGTMALHFGGWPLSYSLAPDYQSLNMAKKAKRLALVYGDYCRILTYATQQNPFVLMPPDFDSEKGKFFNTKEILALVQDMLKHADLTNW